MRLIKLIAGIEAERPRNNDTKEDLLSSREPDHHGGAKKIPKPTLVPQHSFCSLDGTPLRSDGFCPKCGRYFRD